MNRFIITGGTGFIGKKVIENLISNLDSVEIWCTSRNPETHHHESSKFLQFISHHEGIKIAENLPINAVIHLSTMYRRPKEKFSYRDMLQTNVIEPIQILERIVMKNTYFLNVASHLEFVTTKEIETDYYRVTKEFFRVTLESFSKQYRNAHRSIILGDTYGAFDTRDKLLNHQIAEAMRGKRLELHNPQGFIRLSNVNCVATAIVDSVLGKKQGIVSAVSNFEVSIASLGDFVFKVINTPNTKLEDLDLNFSINQWNSTIENYPCSENPKQELFTFLNQFSVH
jgi:nucleoside-diphosphate-sugar epimerase